MLLGFRLLYYLGSRRIFLLGADFEMKCGIGATGNYAFGQQRDDDAIKSNNRQFEITNGWLTALEPTFREFGLEVYNCNPVSGLTAFGHVPFADALEDCRGMVPADEFDLAGWYEKSKETE